MLGPVETKRRAKFVVGGGVVVGVLVGLVVWAMARPGSTSFYMTTSELLAMGGAGAVTETYRVNGNVVPGSIEQEGLQTTFSISDGTSEMTVVTEQPLPDTFRPRSEVVAEGRMGDGVFLATSVSAKCPSKFKAKA